MHPLGANLLRRPVLILLFVLMFIRHVGGKAQLLVSLAPQLFGVRGVTFQLAVVGTLCVVDTAIGLHNEVLGSGQIAVTVRIDVNVRC